MRNVAWGAIMLPEGRVRAAPPVAAPALDHPEMSTLSSVRFLSSSHSSEVLTDDPAQATSEMMTRGSCANMRCGERERKAASKSHAGQRYFFVRDIEKSGALKNEPGEFGRDVGRLSTK